MEFLYQSFFKSWKTTMTAIVGGIVWFLGQNGIVITPEQSNAVVLVALMLIGILSKDANTSHTQE